MIKAKERGKPKWWNAKSTMILRKMSRNSLISLTLPTAQKRTLISSGFVAAPSRVSPGAKRTWQSQQGRGPSPRCCGTKQHVAGSGSGVHTSTPDSTSANTAPRHSLQLQRKVTPAPRTRTYAVLRYIWQACPPLRGLDPWEGRCRFAETLRTQNELHNQCQAQPQQMFLVSQ